jgi:Rrf2 family nitric oxide-sensitive transcriptional repressor
VVLAREKRLMTASELAGKLNASQAFISKIAQQLVHAGLIVSVRGKRGGLKLARRPEEIRVGDIFQAVDGPLYLAACLREGRCRHFTCPLYPVLHGIQDELDGKLNGARLSDLARSSSK